MNECWTCRKEFSFEDSNFSKIFRFFVIETPIETSSARSISLKERKINKTALNKKIKSLSNELKYNWNPIFGDINNVEPNIVVNSLKEGLGIDDNHDKYYTEFAYFITKKNKETETFFYCIRCAFAHGAFCIHKKNNLKYYYFENTHIQGDKIIFGRFIINEENLLKIIDYCNSK